MTSLSTSIDDLRANPRQWEAFGATGHCVVLAPPGSGKTKLLTTRMAFDLSNKIQKPHGAACVTLTNAAADELRRRIATLGVRPHPCLFMGTVHSFILNTVILPFATLAGRPDLLRATIADREQEAHALRAAINTVIPNGADTRFVKSTLDIARKRFSTEQEWALIPDNICGVGRAYLDNLHQEGRIDFTELIEIAVTMVESFPIIRRVLVSKYPQIYVDEYQDLSPGLDRLVHALCFDEDQAMDLFAVGDPDQAILGFTGARPELLIRLSARPDVQRVHLERNYRSGAEIMRIASGMKEGASPTVADREGGRVVPAYCAGGIGAQSAHAAELVLNSSNASIPLHEIVVICPQNAQCVIAVEALRSRTIPAFFRNTDDYRATHLTTFIEGCAAWSVFGREVSGYRLGALLESWRGIIGPRWRRADSVALTSVLLRVSAAADVDAAGLIEMIKAAGLSRALLRPQLADDAIELRRMTKALTDGRLARLSVMQLAERARKVDRVEVTTMTSSKGLEFDHVIILGIDQKRVPFFLALRNAEEMPEERRKFYVSLTRARSRVDILYSGLVEWKNSVETTAPSQFLYELGLI